MLWLKYIIINLNLFFVFYLEGNFNKVNKDIEFEFLILIYEIFFVIIKILCGFWKKEIIMLNNIRLNYVFLSICDYNESYVMLLVRMGK